MCHRKLVNSLYAIVYNFSSISTYLFNSIVYNSLYSIKKYSPSPCAIDKFIQYYKY